jgi:hypothetical protein
VLASLLPTAPEPAPLPMPESAPMRVPETALR